MRVGVAYLEQYFEDAVECLLRENNKPSPSTENSHGNDPDYRFGSALVRRRRILGSQSRPLVMNCILPNTEATDNSDWNNIVRSPLI
jgi:hypothetical protein